MATFARTGADLVDIVEAYMGWSAATSDQQAWALNVVNDAYWKFLTGYYVDSDTPRVHVWSFLRKDGSIVFYPTVTTGTVTVGGTGNKTLTSSTSCFYESMVGQSITAAAGGTYTIDGYTSATVVTVTASAAADTGKVFTVTATGTYGLIAGFAGIKDRLVYAYSAGKTMKDPQKREYEFIKDLQRTNYGTTGMPAYWTIVPRTFDAAAGQRYNMVVDRIPDAAYTANFRYIISPEKLTDSSSVYPVGNPMHSQVIAQMALAEAERQKSKGIGFGPEQAEAQRVLLQAVQADLLLFEDWTDGVEQMTTVPTGMSV